MGSYLSKIFLILAILTVTNAGYATPVESEKNGNIVYFLEASPNEILRYDMSQSRWLAKITLPINEAPSAIAVHDGGIFVAFDRIVYRYPLNGGARLHVVNTPEVISDIAILNNTLIIFHGQYYSLSITTVNAYTLEAVDNASPFYSCQGVSTAPILNRIFCRSSGISPADILYYELDGAGNYVSQQDSPHHGDYPRANNTSVFPEQGRVVDDAGIVYDTSTLDYLGSLGGNFDNITFVDNLPVVLRNNTLTAYSAGLLEAGTYALSSIPDALYSSNSKVFSFHSIASGYNVETLAISDFSSAVPGSPVNPENLQYTPDKMELDSGDGILYLLSKLHLSIFRWSISEQKYLSSISLLKAPSYMALDGVSDIMYLANPDGQIRKIDLNNFVDTHLTTLPQAPLGLATTGDYIFAADPSGAWASHYTFSPSGNLISSVDWNYRSDEYIWNSGASKIYFFRDDTSPNDLLWEEINPHTGVIGTKKDSPYHSSQGIKHPIRISPDGSTVLLGSGRIYNAQTLEYANSLSNEILDAIWLNGSLVTLKNSQIATIQTWSSSYAPLRNIGLQGAALRIFPVESEVLLVSLAAGKPVINLIDLNNVSDSDTDGLIDSFDNCINTPNADQLNLDNDQYGNACDSDIDGDGLPNTYETQIGSNPYNKNDALFDFDNDGETNLDEYLNSTNPLEPEGLDLTSDYFPLRPGTSWTYQQGSSVSTETVLSGTVNVNGIATTVVSSSPGVNFEYYTNDVNGLRLHQTIYAIGDRPGNQTLVLSPPVKLAATELIANQTQSTSGTVTLKDPDFGNFNLTYISNSTVVGTEVVTVPAGTFGAIKLRWELTIQGTIQGSFVSETATEFIWLVNGVGPVKWQVIDPANITSTSVLTSVNIPQNVDRTVFWRNSDTGLVWWHNLNNSQVSSSKSVSQITDLNWEIVGTGDFNNDGQDDAILRNKTSGKNWMWLMNNGSISRSRALAPISDTNWIVAGVEDLNGDGKSDILWRNVITGRNWAWLMDGTSISQSSGLPSLTDSMYTVAGLADIDGDNKADIIWRNRLNGRNWVWLLNGASLKSSIGLPSLPDNNWKVAGMADLDGDGKNDIVWRNGQTGRNWIWLLNGLIIKQSTGLSSLPDTNWNVVSLKDRNNDGRSDILWRNSSTGLIWSWLMNSSSVQNSAPVTRIIGNQWYVVGSP